MAQNFYTKWQNAILADAGGYVSKEYRSFGKATQLCPFWPRRIIPFG